MRVKKLPFPCYAFEGACPILMSSTALSSHDQRMDRTIKEAPVKGYHCKTHDQLRQGLIDFVADHNFFAG